MRLLIVNYHYIRDVKPKGGIYPVTTAEFQAQVELLGAHYRFTSQAELLRMLEADQFPAANLCLLTFDDALAEQWRAIEVLERLSIPAIFFATTDWIADRRPHDVHKLHYIFTQLDETRVLEVLRRDFRMDERAIDEALLSQQYSYDSAGMRRAKYFLNFSLPADERRAAVDRLFAEVEPDERRFSGELYMTPEQLIALARREMLGTHTCSHRPLATLPPEELTDEIAGSKRALERLTGTAIQSISYPYGGSAAVNPAVAMAARSQGLRLGMTMQRGINEETDLREAMMLKRVDTNDAPGGKLRSKQYLP